jgi:hypothetical protein
MPQFIASVFQSPRPKISMQLDLQRPPFFGNQLLGETRRIEIDAGQ